MGSFGRHGLILPGRKSAEEVFLSPFPGSLIDKLSADHGLSQSFCHFVKALRKSSGVFAKMSLRSPSYIHFYNIFYELYDPFHGMDLALHLKKKQKLKGEKQCWPSGS